MLRAALVVPALIALAALPAAAKCTDITSVPVVFLRSTEITPDVFVWDTKERARDYARGYWKSTDDVMNHSVLSHSGTRAIVVQCLDGAIKSKYANEVLDAVGIKLLSGPNRGRYGWVTSDDIHTAAKTAQNRSK